MEISSIHKTSTIAFGPTAGASQLLASASVSGTLGETFETTAALELFRWEPSQQRLEACGGTVAPDRFHALAWGKHGPGQVGLIAGGLTNGVVSVWDPATFDDDKAPVASAAKHAGAVQGLDWNPTMTNLLASSGSDGQLLIWDMANPAKPSVYVPGARVKPVADGMTAVAWNKTASVPHILAGALSNGSCEIWDLKNKKQVIAFHDGRRCTRGGQRSLAWHPSEPTMIVQASEDDGSPVLLLWDLKHYAAPVSVLSGHKRGITCVAWSSDDPALVVTSSRDGSSIVWDLPNARVRSQLSPAAPSGSASAATSAETPYHTQVAFAPLIRGHLATASSDGVVRMHALIDPGPRGRTTAAALGPAPQWLKRPCGASFAFGGRLLRFNSASRTVKIAAVVTDQELLDEARLLKKQSATAADLATLCQHNSSLKGREQHVWSQLAARLEGVDRKESLLQAIGVQPARSSDEDAFAGAVEGEWDGGAPLWGKADWEQEAGRLACSGDVRGAWRACAEAEQWATALLLARELGGEEEYIKCRALWLSSPGAPQLASGVVRALAGPPERLVSQGPLEEWKSLAAAALSWGGEHSGRLLSVLGERLREAGDLSAAQLCLIGANDLDALAATWAHQGISNTESVRRLLCASRAFGIELAPQNSRLAHHLSALADALASQGDMEGALHWLEQIQQPATAPPHIRLLYERLRAAKAPAGGGARKTSGGSVVGVTPAAGIQPMQPRLGGAGSVGVGSIPAPVVSSVGLRPVPSSVAPVARPAPSVFSPIPVPQPMAPAHSPAPAAVPSTVHIPTPSGLHLPHVPVVMPPVVHAPHAFSSPVPAPATAATPEAAHSAATPSPANAAVAAVCERLSRAAEALGGANEQCAKLVDEVAKRLPPLKTKLDSLAPGVAAAVVGLLDSLAEAAEGRDAGRAQQLYGEAQQQYHAQLGSTGMLGLKRVVELIQKSNR